jgi:hypothetical protein
MFNLRTEPEYVPGFQVRDSDEVPGFRMPVGGAEPHISNGLDLYSPYPFAAIGESYGTSPWQYANPSADMAVDCAKSSLNAMIVALVDSRSALFQKVISLLDTVGA